jgi:hypothetical protein
MGVSGVSVREITSPTIKGGAVVAQYHSTIVLCYHDTEVVDSPARAQPPHGSNAAAAARAPPFHKVYTLDWENYISLSCRVRGASSSPVAQMSHTPSSHAGPALGD